MYVARYFKAGTSVSVQSEYGIFVNMLQSPNIAHIIWLNDLTDTLIA